VVDVGQQIKKSPLVISTKKETRGVKSSPKEEWVNSMKIEDARMSKYWECQEPCALLSQSW
jgi:hypothetical protein